MSLLLSNTGIIIMCLATTSVYWWLWPLITSTPPLPSGSQTITCFSKTIKASRTLRRVSRSVSTRKASSCIRAHPSQWSCLPNQAGMTGWQSSLNTQSWTLLKPVPMSLGRGPLISTLVKQWLEWPDFQNCGVASPMPWKLAGWHSFLSNSTVLKDELVDDELPFIGGIS